LLSLPEFDLIDAESVADACSVLQRYRGEAKVLSGGTDLLVKMKHRKMMPRRLINIKGIPGLARIEDQNGNGMRVGALTSIQAIKDSPLIAKRLPLLAQAAGKVGTLHIRNLGTVGGNLANASPSAEFGPPLLVLGASARCVGPGGEHTVPLERFFVAPGKTVLQDDELLTEVSVPVLPAGAAGAYLKHSLRNMEVAIASAAAVLRFDGEVCAEARIALGAVAPTPLRARKAEASLTGQKLYGGTKQSRLFEEIGVLASEESMPIDDIRSDALYRRTVVRMLVERVLQQAVDMRRGSL